MIRKAIIVVLTLGAVGTLFLTVLSVRVTGTRTISGPTDLPSTLPVYGWDTDLWLSDDSAIVLHVTRGRLQVTYWRDGRKTTDGSSTVLDWRVFKITKHWGGAEHPPNGAFESWVAAVHLWVIFAFLVPYPTIALIRGPLRRWQRRMELRCQICGYDLTGNESRVCPECGSEVSS